MIGRAALSNPWIFRDARHYFRTGEVLPPPTLQERWELILRHSQIATQSNRYGAEERHAIMAMRSRLMAYTKAFPSAKILRQALCEVKTLAEVQAIADRHLQEFFSEVA